MDKPQLFSFEDLQKIVSSIADGIISVDADGKVLFINEPAERLLGWNVAEAKGFCINDVFKIVNFQTNQESENPFEIVLQTGRQTGLKNHSALVSKNGEKKLLSANIAPVKDSDGKINGAVAVFRDITRIKKMEDDLRNEKNNLLNIFKNAPVGLVIVDENLTIIDVNDAFINMIGAENEDIRGNCFGDGIGCENSVEKRCSKGSECVYCRLRSAVIDVRSKLEGVQRFNIIFKVKNEATARRVHFNVAAAPISYDDDSNDVILLFEDITLRKKAEDELKESEKKYKNLFMNMISSLSYNKIILDENSNPIDFVFLEINDQFCKLFGRQPEEILGKKSSEVFTQFKEKVNDWISIIGRVAMTGQMEKFEQQVSEIPEKWVNIIAYSNEKEYFGLIISDISDQKKAEKEMKKAIEATNSAYKAKGEFLANMSHEIRTPLNGVVGMIGLTLQTKLNHIQEDNLRTAKVCADALLNIINDILDFSKIEAGKMLVEKIKFDIYDLCKNIMKAHMIKANEKGLILSQNISQNIPRFLNGDPNRLQQVLNNLINNALKFTENGSVSFTVKILDKSDKRVTIEFEVQDTGIGISDGDIDKLFRSFTQVDGSHTRKYGGTGLGLVISKQLLELMGGQMSVSSKKGKGSIFSFKLEFDIAENNNFGLNKNKKIEKTKYKAHLLVAEDDKINQLVIARIFNERGYTYDMVSNGLEAVQKCLEEKYDLCIMDIQMPEMDGIQATKAIRKNEEESGDHIPIVALTAYALNGDRERFLNIGMDEYVAKPIVFEELFEKIESFLINKNEEDQGGKCNKEIREINDLDKINDSLENNTINRMNAMGLNDEYKDPNTDYEILQKSKELNNAIEKNNMYMIEACAHDIKSIFAGIGKDSLKTLAFRIELAARRDDSNEARLLYEELVRMLRDNLK